MTAASDKDRCDQMELVSAYVLHALPLSEASAMEAHIATCVQCRQELQTLRPIIDSFSAWPVEVLRPSTSIWDRLLERIDVAGTEEPATGNATRVAGARMGSSRTRDLLQVARDQY